MWFADVRAFFRPVREYQRAAVQRTVQESVVQNWRPTSDRRWRLQQPLAFGLDRRDQVRFAIEFNMLYAVHSGISTLAGRLSGPLRSSSWIKLTSRIRSASSIQTSLKFQVRFSRHILQSLVGLGITWSTINKNFVMSSYGDWDYTIPEPMDRIDFVFYKGDNVKAVNSFTYGGSEPLQNIPNEWNNDYPSDHYVVATDFLVSVQ